MVHMYAIPQESDQRISEIEFVPVYVTDALFDSEGDIRTLHSHKDTVEVALVYEGRGTVYIDGRLYETKPGDLVVYNTNTMHQDRAADEEILRFFVIGIKNLHLKGKIPGCLIERPDQYCMESREHFMYLLEGFKLLKSEIKKQSPYVRMFAEGFTAALISILFTLAGREKESIRHKQKDIPKLAKKMRDYIEQNYTGQFTLEQLAEHFHINKYYASHVFSKVFGRSPMNYRTYRRIGEAQTLLTCTDYSVSEIGAIVGYDSPGRFGQAFTNLVGMPPSKYREQSLKSARRVEEDTETETDEDETNKMNI